MASPPTFVFVSHSSKDKELTKSVCKELRKALPKSDGFRVLVDTDDLKPNQEWPRYLIEWMARCHSAVLLLTESAIESDWVLKEATILATRRVLDPSFKLFLVFFTDKPDDLLQKHGYGPLFLGPYQRITFTNAAALVKAIRADLAPRPKLATPFEDLISSLKALLKRVDDEALKKVAGKMTEFPALLTLADERERLIDTIATHLVCGHLGALQGVHELVDLINTADAEVVRKILNFVSPYWVNAAAALRLPRLVRHAPRRVAALKCGEAEFNLDDVKFTADNYVRRAHLPSNLFELISLAGGHHDDYATHVTSEICAQMRVRRVVNKKSDEEVVAALATMAPEWYALLPTPVPDDDALNEVIDRFPTITFIVCTRVHRDRDLRLTRVEWLEPEIEDGREPLERENYGRAMRAIDRMLK